MRLKKASDWLYSKSTSLVALVSLCLFLAFAALVLPDQSAAAEAYSGGMGSPDTSLLYSSSDLYQMADIYGAAGRRAYIRARFTFDLVFPLVYTFFLATSVSWLLERALAVESLWRPLNLIPLAGMTFDFLENIAAAMVFERYPIQIPIAAFLAPIFTFIKWIFVGGCFALLFFAFTIFIFRGRK
ncbi:MAG TPA: hypothetical protein VMW28_09160 [Pelolinea sp.]|nr:hypothetical protein [Pelolinea sp.]